VLICANAVERVVRGGVHKDWRKGQWIGWGTRARGQKREYEADEKRFPKMEGEKPRQTPALHERVKGGQENAHLGCGAS